MPKKMKRSAPMLRLENVGVRYGAIQAVDGVSLEIPKGQIVTIIGANGAGKSSLLKAIAGLEPLSSGSVRFEGQEIGQVAAYARVPMGIALSPEGRGVFSDQTVLDNLLLGAFSQRYGPQQLQHKLDEQFRVFPRLHERQSQFAGTLSGGEQQMLAIARALMSSPRLLLLDEPSLGLAPLITAEILQKIRALRDEGLTIVLVEQMANQALRIANHAYVLDKGRVVLQGPGELLRRDPQVRATYLGGH
jgi:branched-chain amino acid transport system ATP-binding protein